MYFEGYYFTHYPAFLFNRLFFENSVKHPIY
jgi:hypothetical protein